jgi:matrixin/IPT/TIG domain-containing protein
MRRTTSRMAALVLGWVCVAGTGSAYYHFIFFNTGSAPFIGAPAKFDLNALTDKRVPFYISDLGPAKFYTGDNFQAVVSEVRAAAEIWNGVSTSEIRLTYGGLYSVGRYDAAPSIDIEFSDDIPPGLLGEAGIESYTALTNGPNGPLVPITRAKMLVPRDLSLTPSFGEQFFVTLVHEFGHTLGLQHTLTSSVMSTLTTSAASKAAPLGADDIAGISLLYPTANYAATVGRINGRVTMNGGGLNLASVVAISASNQAISALTNPDGTYQINGIPPGQYFVYAHPLPVQLQGESSPANIWAPRDVNGNPLAPNYTAFATQFYNGGSAGTRDWQQALPVAVSAGGAASGINFAVSSRSSQAVSSVRTYGYTPTGMAVIPAPVTVGVQAPVPLVAAGPGLLQANNTLTPGLSIGTLGSVATVSDLTAYSPPYIAMYALLSLGTGPGPKHLLFHTPNDLYVLPSGFTAVANRPPSIMSVTATAKLDANGNRTVVVAGNGFQPETKILFDGLPAVTQAVQSDGSLLVTPPPAPGGYIASVVALNADGQSSLFLQAPPTYTYDAGPSFGGGAALTSASLTVTPVWIAASTDTTVNITGTNTNFLDGQTLVGFGSSDVVVKQITVADRTHLTAIVSSSAWVPTSRISVTTGLGIISAALGNQVITLDPGQGSR